MIEEQLPFYGLWFPPWFFTLHPQLKENMEKNSEVLSSSFDVFETLQDVLNSNFDGIQRGWNSRGQSQLYPLSKNRTCKSAGIPNRYCTCIKSTLLSPNSSIYFDVADAFVTHLNFVLKNVSDICHQIKLKKILFVSKLDSDDALNVAKYFDGFAKYDKRSALPKTVVRKFQIGIETQPNRATFETLMKFNGSHWTAEGGISRTSKYAGLSDCVNDKELRKYCSCKSLTGT